MPGFYIDEPYLATRCLHTFVIENDLNACSTNLLVALKVVVPGRWDAADSSPMNRNCAVLGGGDAACEAFSHKESTLSGPAQVLSVEIIY